MQTDADNSTKVRVRFVTSFDQFRIVDTPFVVPSKLERSGLSDVVNHLLGETGEDGDSGRQPFDFMIGDRLVRMCLRKFVALHHLNTEDTITIDYFPATSLADESEKIEAPAWVSCICCRVAESMDTVAAGCYDGQVKILDVNNLFDNKGSNNSTFKAHDEPVRAVHCWGRDGDKMQMATASKDQTIKCWSVQHSSDTGVSATSLATLANGHLSSVECLERISLYTNNKDTEVLLSGDWSGTVCGWDVTDLSPQPTDVASRKKRKSNASTVVANQQHKPLFMMKAHTQGVSGIVKSQHQGHQLFTSSWDHAIKEWDIDRRDCINTRIGPTAMTAVDCTNESSSSLLLATSHTDGKVRLWDARTNDEVAAMAGSTALVALGRSSHWISQVRWKPNSDSKILVSSDYTGSVTLWDVRTTVPLGQMDAHEGKALCCDWLSKPASEDERVDNDSSRDDGSRIISGGSDSNIVTTAVHH